MTKEYTSIKKINPFFGWEKRFIIQHKKINPVHEIVNMYHRLKRTDGMPKDFYKGKNGYPKLAKEAKGLYLACNSVLDDALWVLDQMNYKANKGGFSWSISTCTKYKL